MRSRPRPKPEGEAQFARSLRGHGRAPRRRPRPCKDLLAPSVPPFLPLRVRGADGIAEPPQVDHVADRPVAQCFAADRAAARRTLPTISAGVSEARARRRSGCTEGVAVVTAASYSSAGSVGVRRSTRADLAVVERHRVTGGDRPAQLHRVGHDVTSEGSRRAAASAPAYRSRAGRSSSARRRSRGTSSMRSGSTSGTPAASRPSCWPPPGGRASR